MRLHVMSHLNSVIIRNIPFNLHLLFIYLLCDIPIVTPSIKNTVENAKIKKKGWLDLKIQASFHLICQFFCAIYVRDIC